MGWLERVRDWLAHKAYVTVRFLAYYYWATATIAYLAVAIGLWEYVPLVQTTLRMEEGILALVAYIGLLYAARAIQRTRTGYVYERDAFLAVPRTATLAEYKEQEARLETAKDRLWNRIDRCVIQGVFFFLGVLASVTGTNDTPLTIYGLCLYWGIIALSLFGDWNLWRSERAEEKLRRELLPYFNGVGKH